MFSNSASAQSVAQMKYANSGSAAGHLGSGMTSFASSFSATKQIEGEYLHSYYHVLVHVVIIFIHIVIINENFYFKVLKF